MSKRDLLIKACGNCNKLFETKRAGAKFCGHACYGKWLKGKLRVDVSPTCVVLEKKTFICQECEKEFKDYPQIERKFCSYDCYKPTMIKRVHEPDVIAKRTRHGRTKKDANGKNNKTHNTWGAIISRCHSPNNKAYHNYGGRGVFVCDRWRGDSGFEHFLEDIGDAPGPEYSIDRINNDGPYSPENCRWATHKEQMNNTRKNVNITFNKETHSLVEWGRLLGIKEGTMQSRHNREWSIEKMITTPVNKHKDII